MINAKSLSDEQISQIQSWADGGDVLSDIQLKLAETFELKATYLETRFLLEDLKIELLPTPEPKKEEEEVPEEVAEETTGESEATPAADETPAPAPTGDESATVTIDKVLRPEALISGRVVFNGGEAAAWWLDQMGRLGFEPDSKDFKPSEAQAMAFQKELQLAVQSSGI
ncbi:hypothetical protein VSU19_14785 [Verrucomicrobiales bacterium BCK34]|nr:hypothetical protein [Verrucomicrobiales bacterium BCK34]